jgi:hypothetical protein
MPVKLEDHLFSMEEKFWTQSVGYYREHLACAAIMVFPEPAGVLVKDEIASALDKAPRWSQVALEEHRLLELSEGRAWKLAFHQQTPVAA